jgi:hypothetical protein
VIKKKKMMMKSTNLHVSDDVHELIYVIEEQFVSCMFFLFDLCIFPPSWKISN